MISGSGMAGLGPATSIICGCGTEGLGSATSVISGSGTAGLAWSSNIKPSCSEINSIITIN